MRISVFIVFWVSTNVICQVNNPTTTISLMKEVVNVLAHDSMKGREVASIYEQKSLDFISTKFEEISRRKLKDQPFEFRIDTMKFKSKNSFAFINNHKKETLLIGAHYDHIGLGGSLSHSRTSHEIHNGADDNASGVAMVLSLVPELHSLKSARYNYLIVFYSAHEVGLFGSDAFFHLTQKKRRKFKEIVLVINFDMVGRMNPDHPKLKCMVSANAESVVSTVSSNDFGFLLNIADSDKLKLLDTRSFLESKIPCINFTTGIHLDYHTVSDDEMYINYEGMLQIHHFIRMLLFNISNG